MSTAAAFNSTPSNQMGKPHQREGLRSVTPYLVVPDLAAELAFLKAAFGAEVLFQAPTGHTEVRMGAARLMLSPAGPNWAALHAALHYFVDDVDAVFAQAIAAGGELLMGEQGRPADRPYGERSAFVRDPAGNQWFLAKQTRPADPGITTLDQPLRAYLHPSSAPEQIEFLTAVFGGEELARYGDGQRVMHAVVRIGDAVIEMGEPETPEPQAVYVYVPDPDAAYAKALELGATSLYPPADHHYGERSGGFTDPQGNRWFASRLL